MDDTFQAKILHFLRDGRSATFQEIAHATDIPEEGLSLALGIMVQAGTIDRDLAKRPALYRLKWPVPKEARGAA